MNKIILLDLDGVVIRPRHKYFSDKFSEEYNIPIEEILPFFRKEYKLAAKGEVSVREVLPDYLNKWRWKVTVEEFLNYWFEGETTLDENLLVEVGKLREQGIKVYLVSDNGRERANFVMEKVGLKNRFDGAFFSCDLGFTKNEQDFFKEILDKLKVNSDNIEYWDDDPVNIEVAKSAGIKNAKVYTSFEEFKKEK